MASTLCLYLWLRHQMPTSIINLLGKMLRDTAKPFWVKKRDWSLQTLCNSQRSHGDPKQHSSPDPRDCLALLLTRPWAHYSKWVPSWWSQLVVKRQRAVAVGALGPLSTLGKLCVLGSKSKVPTQVPGAEEGGLSKSASWETLTPGAPMISEAEKAHGQVHTGL